jgi:hypothetical protein
MYTTQRVGSIIQPCFTTSGGASIPHLGNTSERLNTSNSMSLLAVLDS